MPASAGRPDTRSCSCAARTNTARRPSLPRAPRACPVADYCDRQHALQADIYRRFGLSFDHFSRTSGVSLIRAAALAAWPFIPTTAAAVLESVGEASAAVSWPNDGEAILTPIPGGRRISVPPLLFRKITTADVTDPWG